MIPISKTWLFCNLSQMSEVLTRTLLLWLSWKSKFPSTGLSLVSQCHFHPHISQSLLSLGYSHPVSVQLSPQPRIQGHLTPKFFSVFCWYMLLFWFTHSIYNYRINGPWKPFYFRMKKLQTWKVKCKLDFQLYHVLQIFNFTDFKVFSLLYLIWSSQQPDKVSLSIIIPVL